jgi:beta-lactamase regulating signal transducer with metallopeptidase domain
MATLLNGIWQGALLSVLVWLLLKLLPRLNAATRYTVWWIALVVVAVLPLRQPLVGFIPQHTRSTTMLAPDTEALPLPPVTVPNSRHPAFWVLDQVPAAPLSPDSRVTQNWFPICLAARPVSEVIAALWGFASAILLIRLAISYRSMQRLKTRAAPAAERLQQRLTVLAERAGVRRQARLLVSDEVCAPMALGLFDPAILIPRSLPQQVSELDFDHIALHELAHLRRFDDWINLLQKFLEALLPIQPALFWIGRQLTLERETACDDWVIASTGTPKPYVTSLTRIAELSLWARSGILASGAAGHPSQLYQRVQRLLDKRRNIAPRVSSLPLALAVTAVIGLAWVILSAPPMVALANPPSADPVAPIGAAVVLAAAAGADTSPTTQPSEPGTEMRSFSVQPGGRLVVDVDQGDIVVSSWDQNSVRVIVKQKGPNLSEFMEHHHIKMTQEGAEIRVQASADAMPSGFSSPVEILYQIMVPAKFDAQLRDGAGNVQMSDLHGTLDAKSGAGNVGAQQCTGRLNANSGAGNIELGDIDAKAECDARAGNIIATACHGTLQLKSGAGNIEIRKTDAAVEAHADYGNIKATDCAGAVQFFDGDGNIDIHRFAGPSVIAKTATGNVSAELLHAPTADSSLMSAIGNIQLKLDPAAVVNLLATSMMGNVDSEFPTGANQNSGPTLRAITRMGNVQITKR